MRLCDVGRYLYESGISYHDFGRVLTGKKHTGNFFKCDSVTSEQKKKLESDIAGVQFKTCSPEYAPELKRVVIILPIGKIKKTKRGV